MAYINTAPQNTESHHQTNNESGKQTSERARGEKNSSANWLQFSEAPSTGYFGKQGQ